MRATVTLRDRRTVDAQQVVDAVFRTKFAPALHAGDVTDPNSATRDPIVAYTPACPHRCGARRIAEVCSTDGRYVNTGEVREDQLNRTASGVLMSEQLAQSLRALRRRWRIIVLVPLLAVFVSLVVSHETPKQYAATAEVYLVPTNENPVSLLLNPGSQPTPADPERDLNTAVSEITETPMADLARSSLRTSESGAALLAQVSAKLEGTTNIVDITATDADPTRAARIANAFAAQYVLFRLDEQRSLFQQTLALAQSRYAALTPAQQASATGQQLIKAEQLLGANLAVLTSDARVSQTAAVPSSPSKPKPLLDAIVALIVGLLIAIVAVVILELLDRTVRDEDEAVAVSGLSSLGVIPKAHAAAKRVGGSRGSSGARAAGAHSPLWARHSSPDWALEESHSSVAVSLLSLRLGPDENVVMITSPGPRDGKTSVTLGLAAALAELGRRVVAVECDLRRPRFAEYLGLPADADGLSSILSGRTEAPTGLVNVSVGTVRRGAVRPRPGTRVAGGAATTEADGEAHFTVLPCGPIPPLPLALLGGTELGSLVGQLQLTADVVLVDTPPLGAIKDAIVLGSVVDHVALVARIGHTRRDALRHCRAAVDQLGVPLLGIVTVGGPRGGDLSYYGHAGGHSPAGAIQRRSAPAPAERQPEPPRRAAKPRPTAGEKAPGDVEPITTAERERVAQRPTPGGRSVEPQGAGKPSRPRRRSSGTPTAG